MAMTRCQDRLNANADASAEPCLSFAQFRMALRKNRIDAVAARRLFRRHYSKLGDICRREGCSLQRARTINAILKGDVNAALLKAGRPGILKASSAWVFIENGKAAWSVAGADLAIDHLNLNTKPERRSVSTETDVAWRREGARSIA